MKRFFLFLISFILIISGQPMLGFIFGMISGLFLAINYYEIVFLGIIIDVMYQTSIIVFNVSLPLYTLIGIVGFVILKMLKKRMNIHV